MVQQKQMVKKNHHILEEKVEIFNTSEATTTTNFLGGMCVFWHSESEFLAALFPLLPPNIGYCSPPFFGFGPAWTSESGPQNTRTDEACDGSQHLPPFNPSCLVFASFLFFTFFSACLCFPFQILCLNGTSFFLAKLLPHTRPPALADAVSQNTFIEGMGVFHSWTRESWYIFKMLYSQPPLHANSLLEMFLFESLFMWFSFPLTWFPPLQTVELPLLHSYCRWKIIKGAMCWCSMWMWKQDETGANF